MLLELASDDELLDDDGTDELLELDELDGSDDDDELLDELLDDDEEEDDEDELLLDDEELLDELLLGTMQQHFMCLAGIIQAPLNRSIAL